MDEQDSLQRLKKRIEKLSIESDPRPEITTISKKHKAVSAGYVCSYLSVSLLVGMVIGYYLDQYFATKPLFFLICFLLGFTISIIRIYKLGIEFSKDNKE